MKSYRYTTLWLLVALLAIACSNDGGDGDAATKPNEEAKEIRIQTNVTKMQTRATTIDNITDYDLKIDAYYHGTETKYLNGTKLHYDKTSEPNAWKFWIGSDPGAETHYYWPITGSTVTIADVPTVASTLDFVGFCPFDKPSYIGDPTYNHSTGVSFTCNMSNYMTLARQTGAEDPTIPTMQEFLVSVLPEQTLATQTEAPGGALPMVFKHPFALIKFTITAASGTHVQINSISIADLYTNATCTYNGTTMTWGTYTGSAAITIGQTLKNGGTTESTPFVVIPNDYGTKYLTVNATWNDWSNTVTISDYGTNVDFNWEPGRIYTYNLTLDKYGLKVDTSKFTEQW